MVQSTEVAICWLLQDHVGRLVCSICGCLYMTLGIWKQPPAPHQRVEGEWMRNIISQTPSGASIFFSLCLSGTTTAHSRSSQCKHVFTGTGHYLRKISLQSEPDCMAHHGTLAKSNGLRDLHPQALLLGLMIPLQEGRMWTILQRNFCSIWTNIHVKIFADFSFSLHMMFVVALCPAGIKPLAVDSALFVL